MRALFFFLIPLGLTATAAAEPPPLSLLSDAEKSYYDQSFDYAMETVAPNGKYEWRSHSSHGSFTVEKGFISKSKSTCRNYSETFTVAGKSGTDKGVACKRQGRDGWCRLKKGDALTCAMEAPDNPVQETLRSTTEAGESLWNRIKSWFR